VWGAVEAGASGYLLKDSDDRTLVEAVMTVARGGSYLDKSLTHTVLNRMRSGSQTTTHDHGLTPREIEVLRMVSVGASNKEVADALGLSVRTIEVHMSHVLEKLGARSRTEAVVSAVKSGLLDIRSDP
jgi:DNA-binding NarL/FixJ family response regulator